jgi:hypothetical protein
MLNSAQHWHFLVLVSLEQRHQPQHQHCFRTVLAQDKQAKEQQKLNDATANYNNTNENSEEGAAKKEQYKQEIAHLKQRDRACLDSCSARPLVPDIQYSYSSAT